MREETHRGGRRLERSPSPSTVLFIQANPRGGRPEHVATRGFAIAQRLRGAVLYLYGGVKIILQCTPTEHGERKAGSHAIMIWPPWLAWTARRYLVARKPESPLTLISYCRLRCMASESYTRKKLALGSITTTLSFSAK